MNDLIFVSMENWDDVWRRNQFVCAELARRHPEMKILFVGHARNLTNDLRRGRLTFLRTAATFPAPGFSSITVTHPLKLAPGTLTLGRLANEAMVRLHVRAVSRQIGLRDPVLWLNPHYAVHMVGHIGERATLYDITDDWISLTQSDRLRQMVERQDAELCRRADAVIVCSRRLFDMKRGLTNNLHLIPNGVDASHYRQVIDAIGPLPPESAGWPRPVLGYTGTIHHDRLDVNLVEEIARKLTAGSIVLIGPNLLSEGQVSRLKQIGNVFIPGPVPYERIPQMMRAFDVCIVPHRVTPFTESLNPIKLWEYLAAGKPIVSTDIAGFRDYPRFVRIARDADAFLAAVAAGMGEDGSVRDARREEAGRHSWTSRVDEIEKVLSSCLKR